MIKGYLFVMLELKSNVCVQNGVKKGDYKQMWNIYIPVGHVLE